MDSICVRDLHKRYRAGVFGEPRDALRGVSLTIRRGGALGLIGPNGAGKTTLLKILLGLVAQSAGTVEVLGADPNDVATRRRIGYLPERLSMPASFTPRSFLHSVARLKGLPEREREVERQLERVGLAAERDSKIGRFSKGMKQRLGLAAALLGAPELLVLDEPTDGIDPQGRAMVRRILGEERARGCTLFLNSHLLGETERVCDEVCILVAGRVVTAGRLLAVCGDPQRFSVRFQCAMDGALTPLGFQPTGEANLYHFEGSDAVALNRQLDRARELGAIVIELRPEVRTLEDVLLSALERPDA